MLISVISTFVLLSLLLWFMGAKIQNQVEELAKTLPSTVNTAKVQLAQTSFGRKVLEKTSSTEVSDKVYSFGSSFFNSTFGAFGDIYIIFRYIFYHFTQNIYRRFFKSCAPVGEGSYQIHA